MSSFTQKELRVTLVLADKNSVFPETNSNTLKLTGNRILANIQAVSDQPAQLDIRIFGMRQADMNALTITFFGDGSNIILQNTIIIESNDGSGWVQIYQGNLTEAQPEYRAAPEVYFHIVAQGGFYSQIAMAEPISFVGSADAAGIVQTIAGKLGFAFENNGVTAQLSSPYYADTLFNQLRRVCRDAGINWYLHGKTLAIAPLGYGRSSIPAVILDASSGLQGYPTIQQGSIVLEALFDPAFTVGSPLLVKGTPIPAANRKWNPIQMLHTLESMMPNGQWRTSMTCVPWIEGGV